MVGAHKYFAISILLLLSAVASGQYFPVSDTVTEYNHKGTFYHDKFEGRKTASGEIFDQNGFTAAHWKIKLGTYVQVTNRNTGLQVIVKINDRCPKHGVLDLSHRAATAIGIKGCQPVTVRLLPSGYEEICEAQDAMFDSVYSRLNPAPKTPPAESKQEVAKEEPKAAPAKHVEKKHGNDCYVLILCTVKDHGEAYGKIQQLPQHYRDKVSVETLDEGDGLRLSLDQSLHRTQAEDLARALRRNFPEVKVEACR